ncbi:MAG: DUF2344 domain-containing protein [Candidatus Hydrogenedentota bacterium]
MATWRVKLTRVDGARWQTPQEFIRAVRDAALAGGLPLQRAKGDRGAWRVTAGAPPAAGQRSCGDYVDLELEGPLTAHTASARLQAHLPPGMELLWMGQLPPGAPAISRAVQAIRYAVWSICWDSSRIAAFEAAVHWPCVRKKLDKIQEFDLKTCISRLEADGPQLRFDTAVRAEGVPKPYEVVSALFCIPRAEAILLPVERLGVRLDRSRPSQTLEYP